MAVLGKTGLEVGPIGLGTHTFGTEVSEEESFALMDAFAAAGGLFLDTANVYGRFSPHGENESEKVIGRWIRSRHPQSVIVATKGGHYNPPTPKVMRLGKEEIEHDLDESLRTLGLEYLDFYWLHRDDETRPVEEIIESMESLVKKGKIRFYGASNYTAERMKKAKAYADANGYAGFCALSNQYSVAVPNKAWFQALDPTLLFAGEEELAFCQKTGTPLVAYQASAGGYYAKLASGQPLSDTLIAQYDNEQSRAHLGELMEKSRAYGCSVQAAALIALIEGPCPVIPLCSVRNREQFSAIFEVLKHFS